jgi:hypothetical protein
LGTVRTPKIPCTDNLFQLDSLKPLLFRIFVCEPETQKIIGSCEGLVARNDTEEEGSIPLLPVEQHDLGERLWVLETGDGDQPVLKVNNEPELMMFNKLSKDADPHYRALIIPEALNQALVYVFDSHTEAEWKKSWIDFIIKLGKKHPDDVDENNQNEVKEWASSVVDVWLKTNPMKSHILMFEGENEN